MRELKFRARIKKVGDNKAESKRWEYFYLWELEGKKIRRSGEIIEFFEQYTGLKDKNGKEIYEGDIVQIDSMDEIRVGYVELVADQYCIVCGEDEEGNKIVAEFYYYSKPEENCKVIGNIHETPELLGGKE